MPGWPCRRRCGSAPRTVPASPTPWPASASPAWRARRPSELSGGQRQRVALARALLTTRPVLLLDEPLSGLDPALRRDMVALIDALRREKGLTVLMTTHTPEDVEGIADLDPRSSRTDASVARPLAPPPRLAEPEAMRILLVFCHPCAESYGAAVRDAALAGLAPPAIRPRSSTSMPSASTR